MSLDHLTVYGSRKAGPSWIVQDCGFRTACWVWMGALDKDGYGLVWHDGKTGRAARLFYERVNGSLGPLVPDHQCGIRSCVNPEHVTPTTRSLNSQRKRNLKLSRKQVEEIRVLATAGTNPSRMIAHEFGVHSDHVRRIIGGRRWRVASC